MLRKIVQTYWRKMLLAYSFTTAGQIAELLYPFATGLAINGVLTGNYYAILWLVGCHSLMLILTVTSKMLDTRIFTRIYAEFATHLSLDAHKDGIDPSIIAARSSLSRSYMDFFDLQMPKLIYALTALCISLGMLFWFDPVIGGMCLALLVPLAWIGLWLSRRSEKLNQGLNNRLEQEVSLLQLGKPISVSRHFAALSGWRIRLSDAEARAFGTMEIIVIILFVISLWKMGQEPALLAGTIYAIFSYIWRFVSSLDQAPEIIQQLAKMRDLDRRFATAELSTAL
jgi:ABC-type bacteriocin/lantibiotic exporter with double-glycine peptidase domain